MYIGPIQLGPPTARGAATTKALSLKGLWMGCGRTWNVGGGGCGGGEVGGNHTSDRPPLKEECGAAPLRALTAQAAMGAAPQPPSGRGLHCTPLAGSETEDHEAQGLDSKGSGDQPQQPSGWGLYISER